MIIVTERTPFLTACRKKKGVGSFSRSLSSLVFLMPCMSMRVGCGTKSSQSAGSILVKFGSVKGRACGGILGRIDVRVVIFTSPAIRGVWVANGRVE